MKLRKDDESPWVSYNKISETKVKKVWIQIELLTSFFPLHKQLKHNLISSIKSTGDQHNKATNVKAYMTQWCLDTPETKVLLDWVKNEIYNFLTPPLIHHFPNGDSNPDIVRNKLEPTDYWGAVYKKGDYAKSHEHTCAYSWVYFINCPKGSAPLVLTDSKTKIKAEEGKVVIFPGLTYHHVPKNNCDDRIVMAGNWNHSGAGKRNT